MGQQPTASAPVDDDDPPLCPACGYDLRGHIPERCSECGHAIDPAMLRQSGIPWAHRRWIGRIRAYVKSVWLVTADRSLKYEMNRPQDLRDARAFVRVTSALLAISLLVFAVLFALDTLSNLAREIDPLPGRWLHNTLIPWAAGITLPLVLPVLAIAVALTVPRTPRLLFASRKSAARQRERAVALCFYSTAPLAWLFVGAVCFVPVCLLLDDVHSDPMFDLVVILSVMAGVASAIAVIATPYRVTKWYMRARRVGLEYALLAGPALMGLWVLDVVILLGVVPWFVGLVWIVIDSYR